MRPPYYSVFVTNHSSKNTAISMFAMWRHLSNNVALVLQVLTLCAPRRPHFLQMAACFRAPYKFTFKHRFLCLICPELLHSYHNCNVDSFFATDEQFQYGMNVDFNRITNAHFRQQVKMAASLSRTFHTSIIVIVAVILIIIVI